MRARTGRSPRGASLLVAMLIIVVMTLLVAGAIVFTGSERSTATLHSTAEQESACVQAAKNLFVSKIRVLQGNTPTLTLNENLILPDGGTMNIRSGHYNTPASTTLKSVTKLPDNGFQDTGNNIQDISNRVGSGGSIAAAYYQIVAVCSEGGQQQEVEFGLRVGI